MLLAHGQPVHQGPEVLLRKADFICWPQYILVYGVIPPQGQDFSFPFVELHDIHVGPFLQHVEVPLANQPVLPVLYHQY